MKLRFDIRWPMTRKCGRKLRPQTGTPQEAGATGRHATGKGHLENIEHANVEKNGFVYSYLECMFNKYKKVHNMHVFFYNRSNFIKIILI